MGGVYSYRHPSSGASSLPSQALYLWRELSSVCLCNNGTHLQRLRFRRGCAGGLRSGSLQRRRGGTAQLWRLVAAVCALRYAVAGVVYGDALAARVALELVAAAATGWRQADKLVIFPLIT